ncbi:hypothetical protein BpHYR1_014840, partial [Brachionus plicatilis]
KISKLNSKKISIYTRSYTKNFEIISSVRQKLKELELRSQLRVKKRKILSYKTFEETPHLKLGNEWQCMTMLIGLHVQQSKDQKFYLELESLNH